MILTILVVNSCTTVCRLWNNRNLLLQYILVPPRTVLRCLHFLQSHTVLYCILYSIVLWPPCLTFPSNGKCMYSVDHRLFPLQIRDYSCPTVDYRVLSFRHVLVQYSTVESCTELELLVSAGAAIGSPMGPDSSTLTTAWRSFWWIKLTGSGRITRKRSQIKIYRWWLKQQGKPTSKRNIQYSIWERNLFVVQ